MEGAGAEGAGMKGVERIEEENPMGILSSPPGDTPPPSTRTCSSIGSNSFREIAGLLSWWGRAARAPSTCNAGSTACPALVGRVSTVSPQVSSKSAAPTQTCLRGSFEAASRPPCNYLQGACITLTKARGTWRKRRWMPLYRGFCDLINRAEDTCKSLCVYGSLIWVENVPFLELL